MACTTSGTLSDVAVRAVAVDPAQHVLGGVKSGLSAWQRRAWRCRKRCGTASSANASSTAVTARMKVPQTHTFAVSGQKKNRAWRICGAGALATAGSCNLRLHPPVRHMAPNGDWPVETSTDCASPPGNVRPDYGPVPDANHVARLARPYIRPNWWGEVESSEAPSPVVSRGQPPARGPLSPGEKGLPVLTPSLHRMSGARPRSSCPARGSRHRRGAPRR
jgi:hypothetical protein